MVLGPAAVRAHLIDAARPFIFDTGLAPAAVGAAWAALRVLVDEPWRAQAVLDHAAALAEICGVAELPDSAVVSVILGEPEVAFAAAVACLDRGVRVGCFRPPTVPAGTSRLRLTARASLSDDEMALAREVLTEVLSCRARVSVLVVTGTDTGVGKTVATAALACRARLAGVDVAVCKPVQTGSPRDDDLADVARLSGVSALHGDWRYPEPLAPVAAAERAGMALPTRDELVASVAAVDAER